MKKKRGVSEPREDLKLESWIDRLMICDFDDNMDEFAAK
jgi:hypothetical protein